jgi:hypothetical protein
VRLEFGLLHRTPQVDDERSALDLVILRVKSAARLPGNDHGPDQEKRGADKHQRPRQRRQQPDKNTTER